MNPLACGDLSRLVARARRIGHNLGGYAMRGFLAHRGFQECDIRWIMLGGWRAS